MKLESIGAIARFFAKTVPEILRYVSVIIILIPAISILAGIFIPTFSLSENTLIVHAAMVGAGISLLYFYHNSYYKMYTDINFENSKQIKKIRDLIGRTERSLIMFSGEFNSSVYNDPRILSDLKNLPNNCELKFYYSEDAVDKKSEEFLQFVKERGALLERVKLTRQGHFTVSDRSHLRLEYSCSPHAQSQYASYHYWRPDFADHVLEKFRRNAMMNDDDISPSSLPF